jgi:TonB-linked SusC/RagA family outer membrane protein
MRKTLLRFFKAGMIPLFIIGITSFSVGQVRTITGTISASDTKESLPGATIQIKGTTSGTTTNIDGKYSIQLPPGPAVLVFSFMGYTSQEIEVKEQTVIDVVLQPTQLALSEVVVIGYGTVKKSDLTGSVSSIKSEDITKITALNPVQSLQGQVTGVQVTSTSGQPGANPTVLIRGIGSFSGTNPIYVVDGVILDDISFINSQDIKSMEVLKDASATAIYGSRGANGVILITTKSGQIGQEKTTFSFTGEVGIQRLAKKIDLLNGTEFATISNEIVPGSYNNVNLVPNTDWQDLIFHTAPLYNFQLSASGSTKATQYYASVGYYGQEGIIDKSYYNRITIQLNNTYNLSQYVKLGNNITITPFKEQIAPDVTYSAYRAMPVAVPYNPDGSFAEVQYVGNPLADLAYSNNYNKGIKAVGNLFLQVNFLKMFTFKTSYGIDAGYFKAESFTPAYYVSPQQENLHSLLFKGTSDNLTWLWENTLTFDKDFGKHSINAVGGYTMQNTSSEGTSLTGQNIIRDGSSFWYILPSYVYDPSQGINNISMITNGVDPNQYYSMISYLVRANYVYDNRYIITATFRRDGSSKFAKGNQYSNFPSFAVGWNMSNEKFMKPLKFLTKLKLRASWGQIGNDKIDYSSRYSLVDSKIITIFGINNDIFPGATYDLTGNPNLKWEVTTQADAGLELGFLNDRLTGEFDYYHKVTNDILVPLSTPGYLGNGTGALILFNAGSMLNTGFEFKMDWRDQVGKFKYGVGLLGSTIHNEVVSIGGSSGVDSVLLGGYLANGIPVTQSKKGLPIGAFYGYKTNGLFQTQQELDAYPHMAAAGVGDLRFVDVNGDGKIDGNDRTYIGSPIPKFTFGFNFNCEIYGIDFSVDVQGQTGNQIFNAKDVVRPDPYNFEQSEMGRWTGPGTSNTVPKPSFGGYNYIPSDYFLQDGSYMRIRNVTLGYTLPGKWSNKLTMQKIRVYFKVDNLYTLTKYTGYTPEIAGTGVLSNGIDYGVYPITAVYFFGLNLNF